MLTLADVEILMPLIDAGVRATGLQVFQNDGGHRLQEALKKLQQIADAPQTPERPRRRRGAN